jgi:predicted SAM-dependent methyltransferase
LPGILQAKPAGDILVFAPELVLLNQLQSLQPGQILTTDFYHAGVDFPGEDIQNMSFEQDSFALMMCNHVLEHILDDVKALHECARVLMPRGVALFTIPGDFRVQSTWYFDRPDSNGHYRHYGMDVIQKMRSAFQKVDPIDMGMNLPSKYGVRKNDYLFVCFK